jgi:kynurenine formamidase
MRPSIREMRMTSANVLANLAGMLASGAVEVVDCTGVLGPETPLLKLPPDFAKDTPPIKIHRISEYDKDGPFWAWNWLELGEHSGTHFDAPHHWITGKDYADGYTDTLKVQRLVAPVNVLDFSQGMRRQPGFPADHRPCEGNGRPSMARSTKASWVVLRSDWDKRSTPMTRPVPERQRDRPAYARPDGRSDPVSDGQGHRRLGQPVHRHRCGAGRRHEPALPGAQPFAQEQLLRPGKPCQPGQAAAKGAILIAAPLKIKKGTGSPIRALALVPRG